MRNHVLVSVLLALASQVAAQTGDAEGDLRGTAWVGLASYDADDVPTVFVQFQNRTSGVTQWFYPTGEQLDIFPCDLLWVFKDGQKLPYARSPERHPRPAWRTSLQPAGTLTLAVPLDVVCTLPQDPRGHYRVQIVADYFPGHVSAEPVEFDIRPAAPAATTEQMLARADWRVAFADKQAAAGHTEELIAIARQAASPDELRARAIQALAPWYPEAGLGDLWPRWVTDPDPVVALAAIRSIKDNAVPAQLVMKALNHDDLGIRRAAAQKLIEADLDTETKASLAKTAESEHDELLREYIRRAIR